MAKNFRIEYLPIAQTDMIDIFDYISKENTEAADALLQEFSTKIAQLEKYPFIGPIAKDFRLQQLGYRTLIVEKYIIFYIVKDFLVEIRRILHGSRKYSFLL